MSDISRYVNIEEFSKNYKEVAEIVGIDKAVELSSRFGGTHIYIPKLDGIHRKVRNLKIRADFNGCNISDLARKYELTDIQIRTILRVREASIEDFIKEDNNEFK